jgi:hypothetical protein
MKHAILAALLGLTLAACHDSKPKVIIMPGSQLPPGYQVPSQLPPAFPGAPTPAAGGIQPIAPGQCNGTTIGPDGWVSACGGAVVGGAPGAAVFDVPSALPGLGTVIRSNTWGPLLGRTVVMRYVVDGDCQLQAKGDGQYDPGEPMLTLYIQQGPQLSNAEDGRWYAGKARGKLTETGSYEMRAPVMPADWSNMMGHSGIGRDGPFQDAANNATYVGFVAGGGYFAHQVWCGTGTKRVVVTDFHVE